MHKHCDGSRRRSFRLECPFMTDILLHKYELRGVLEAKQRELKDEINSLQPDYLLNVSEQDLHVFLVDKYRIDAPVLLRDDATTAGARDAKIDVSGNFRYGVFDRSQPFYITGTEVTMEVPFRGERDLFFCQASTFNLKSTARNGGQRSCVALISTDRTQT
jgi:hypothetical protein